MVDVLLHRVRSLAVEPVGGVFEDLLEQVVEVPVVVGDGAGRHARRIGDVPDPHAGQAVLDDRAASRRGDVGALVVLILGAGHLSLR
nr:hypothetical protein [Micromonospora sp. WMMB482]